MFGMVKLTCNKMYTSYRRNGSQLAELPPALMLLFFVILFPLLNLLCLCLSFGAGWYLNQIEMRDIASQIPPAISAGATNTFTPSPPLSESTNWNGFLGVTEEPGSPSVTQTADSTTGLVSLSKVTTTVSIRPFIFMCYFRNLPWLSELPGLGRPITFTYTNSIFQEEGQPSPSS